MSTLVTQEERQAAIDYVRPRITFATSNDGPHKLKLTAQLEDPELGILRVERFMAPLPVPEMWISVEKENCILNLAAKRLKLMRSR